MSEAACSLRLDLWLYRTRFFKTRTLATAFAAKGKVRISRFGSVRRAKNGAVQVLADDILTFAQKQRIIMIKVLAMPERRGPAVEAVLCYESLEEKHV